MPKRIAKFEKVSYNQFFKAFNKYFPAITDTTIDSIYKSLKLPARATIGSAGYDFYSPLDINLKPGETIIIPTGIRVKMELDWVLKLYPRSGLGFKYRLHLDNTIGIIDSDYYNNSDNEGHIFAKITNESLEQKTINISSGSAFIQGIFLEYGITIDDDVNTLRQGGIGSTSR